MIRSVGLVESEKHGALHVVTDAHSENVALLASC